MSTVVRVYRRSMQCFLVPKVSGSCNCTLHGDLVPVGVSLSQVKGWWGGGGGDAGEAVKNCGGGGDGGPQILSWMKGRRQLCLLLPFHKLHLHNFYLSHSHLFPLPPAVWSWGRSVPCAAPRSRSGCVWVEWSSGLDSLMTCSPLKHPPTPHGRKNFTYLRYSHKPWIIPQTTLTGENTYRSIFSALSQTASFPLNLINCILYSELSLPFLVFLTNKLTFWHCQLFSVPFPPSIPH